ncbi:hypothetical protein BV902_05130 [Sphingobacterium sp. B29]|nr:hypothetical protein BV902_05130 [Sphingobacterium sp. B29]
MENKAYLHLYPMKSILRLFLFKPGQILVFVLMHVTVYGQRSYGDKFQELSATVQHYAAKNNMILPKGRYEFYKLDRAILWSYKQDLFWPLNRLILKDKAIRDSMTDELYINFDREYNRFVMDVYESPYKFNEARPFEALSVQGSFRGGMSPLVEHLSKFLLDHQGRWGLNLSSFTLYMDRELSAVPLAYDGEPEVVKLLKEFFEEAKIPHKPGIYYGNPMYCSYRFDWMANKNKEITLDCAVYKDYFNILFSETKLYALGGTWNSMDGQMSFFYDRKNSWKQFAARRDVKRILDFLNEEAVVNLFKLHHGNKRFSGDYWLDVVMLK